ncbi:MAG: four-carbon acid sugar kinase family protein [Acidobacteria bacterium]|nr:four-carbon acid sugar kinase family protein [Acidobacteriota bacterium]
MRKVCWYGDDFTGSTDVLEALAPQMPAVLFLRVPSAALFARFAGYEAIGLAGESRSQSPEWMDAHLPAAFEWLRGLGAALCHYKVCSTFDSSPEVGSIGRAMEIGRRVFGGSSVPVVVGAPPLGRYTYFGNLFAQSAGVVYRIDRHPVVMRHPVTPMLEADLRVHLAAQTALHIGLLDALHVGDAALYRELLASHEAVLIDVMNEESLAAVGALLWDAERRPFVVGSSGVEYALGAHWRIAASRPAAPPAADRMVVLSGSCSEVTARQIAWAGRNGYALLKLDVRGEMANGAALEALRRGQSVVMYTSGGVEDRLEGLTPAARQEIGERCGRLLRQVVDASGVRRVIIAGGDTASHAGRQLGIDALTFLAHVAPGAPLCKAWAEQDASRELEVVFKGGQCGGDDFFEQVRSLR